MRSLLHDYLATDGEASYRDGQGKTSAGSVFSRATRDRSKRMFKLSDVDTNASELSKEREDLERILRSSVPGLVQPPISTAVRPDTNFSSNRASSTWEYYYRHRLTS
jgi:hypothetical protein